MEALGGFAQTDHTWSGAQRRRHVLERPEGPGSDAGFLSDGPDRLVFDERHLTMLQRLLVEHAQEHSAEMLSDHERAALLFCLLVAQKTFPSPKL